MRARCPRKLGRGGELPVVPQAHPHYELAATCCGRDHLEVEGSGELGVADRVEALTGAPLPVGGVEKADLGVVVGLDEAGGGEGRDGGVRHGHEGSRRGPRQDQKTRLRVFPYCPLEIFSLDHFPYVISWR